MVIGRLLRTWWSAVVGAGVVAGVAAGMWLIAASRNDPTLLEDLHIYRGAIRLADSGASLYDYQGVGPFTYPPFAAMVMWPLAQLPVTWLDPLWTIGTFACAAVLAVALVARLPRTGFTWLGPSPTPTALSAFTTVAAIIVMTSIPLVINFWLGQISAALTVLVLLDVGGLVPRRFRGVLTGVAAAVKLTPLIFIPYFLATKQWRAAAQCVGGFLGATAVAAVFYPADTIAYWTRMVMQTSRVGELEAARNHSVLGVLSRWHLDLPSLWLAIVAIAVLAALIRARQHFARGELVSAALVIGSASLVASPISWPHHLVWTILAGVWLLGRRSLPAMALGVGIVITQSPLWVWDTSSVMGISAALADMPTWTALAICVFGLGQQHGRDHSRLSAAPVAHLDDIAPARSS